MTQKKAVKKQRATKASAKKKVSTTRRTKSPRVRSAATNTVPEAVESDEVARCLAAFELGLLANEAAWNFDQALFALSRIHRQELSIVLQKLRGVGARLSSMTTDSALAQVLKRIEEWIPSFDEEWFSEAVERAANEAVTRQPTQAPNITYFQELRCGMLDVRHELEDPIVNSTLQTPTERLWFRLGVLADSGRHRPDVARQSFDIDLQEPLAAVNAYSNDAATSPEALPPAEGGVGWNDLGFSRNRQREVPRNRTFSPGEQVPPEDWPGQVIALLKLIDPKSLVDHEEVLISGPQSVIEATERLITTISSLLTLKPQAPISVDRICLTITINGFPHPLGRIEAAVYLGVLLRKNDWMSDSEVGKELEASGSDAGFAATRWTRIRENLPAEIRALLETHRAKGTRFRPR